MNQGSELLTKQINTVLALRKIKYFELQKPQNPKKSTIVRPQMHLLLVKPFGTLKSAATQQIRDCLGDDLITIDEFSKASVLGTITKDKKYVAGLPGRMGGKVIVVDEFNNIGEFGQKALLSILENQRIDRELGFAVKEPVTINPNEWTYLEVDEGHIHGELNFSCIAYAMYYPKLKQNNIFEDNPQALLALKSRFTPNFNCPEHDELMDLLGGESAFEIHDYGKGPARHIHMSGDTVTEYVEYYREATRKLSERLDNKQKGFLTRINMDLLRFSAYDIMKESGRTKMINLDDLGVLKRNVEDWSEILLDQYLYEEDVGTFEQYKELVHRNPGQVNEWYARRLNKSIRQIQRWKKNLDSLFT